MPLINAFQLHLSTAFLAHSHSIPMYIITVSGVLNNFDCKCIHIHKQ